MRNPTFLSLGVVLLACSTAASAGTFRFDTDPFAGTNVLTTPGRQIVGGEDFIAFSIATDVFSLESTVFGVDGPVKFVNGTAAALPTGGVNVIVLESFDDDNNPATPFGAGNAASLIATRITTPGAGFFIYFNQALDLPRLVYSTDLSSGASDLKILARMLNLNGAEGRNAMPEFTAANFDITHAAPEPSSAAFALAAMCLFCGYLLRRKLQGKSKRTGTSLAAVALCVTPAFSQSTEQSGKRYAVEFTKLVDTTREFSSFGNFPAIDNHGEVAFTAALKDGTFGVFRAREEGDKLTAIASTSDYLSAFGDDVAVNASGVVVFDATTASGSRAIFKGDGHSKTLIADSTVNGLAKSFIGAPSINAVGKVAFLSLLAQRGSPAAIFTGNGGPLTTVASTSPGGFSGFQNVAINASGTIVFGASFSDQIHAIFTIGSGLPFDIVDTSKHPEIDSFGDPVINDAGTIADVAFVLPFDAPEIFSGIPRGITPRSNPANPAFPSTEHPSLNNFGAVAFAAIEVSVGGTGPTGIFLEASGAQNLIPIVRPGDNLFGSTVDHVDLGRFALNDRFQMAFSYTLKDGRSGVAIASFNGEREGDDRSR